MCAVCIICKEANRKINKPPRQTLSTFCVGHRDKKKNSPNAETSMQSSYTTGVDYVSVADSAQGNAGPARAGGGGLTAAPLVRGVRTVRPLVAPRGPRHARPVGAAELRSRAGGRCNERTSNSDQWSSERRLALTFGWF